MEFTSQICTTKEQSARLLSLGLKRETADMVILEHPRKEGRYFYIAKEDANFNGFPAWSLHRLIEIYSKNSIVPTVKLDEIDFDWLVDEIEFRIKERDIYENYLEK